MACGPMALGWYFWPGADVAWWRDFLNIWTAVGYWEGMRMRLGLRRTMDEAWRRLER